MIEAYFAQFAGDLPADIDAIHEAFWATPPVSIEPSDPDEHEYEVEFADWEDALTAHLMIAPLARRPLARRLEVIDSDRKTMWVKVKA